MGKKEKTDSTSNIAPKKSNSNLHKAREVKNDEFYTLLPDIEKELKNYKEYLRDKVIFCNCDDPEWSNFYKYFSLNFKHLGIKKVITTHFEKITPPTSYKLVMELDENGETKTTKTILKGNGDFRSEESIEILKESDIVITNPPFSLFREFIAQLIAFEKKFIIIGSKNAITYKETFNYIKNNQLWLGVTSPKEFNKPDKTTQKFGNIGWYTNIPHKNRNEKIDLFKKYVGNEQEYPKYDGYDIIEVSKVVNIPVDYQGVMGVPITFLDKYNPDQFELLGQGNSARWLFYKALTIINGVKIYNRLFIKKK